MDRISFEKERRGGFDARCWSYNFELKGATGVCAIQAGAD